MEIAEECSHECAFTKEAHERYPDDVMHDFEPTTIDVLYSRLKKVLDAAEHEEECPYRCLNPDCRLLHGCAVCAPEADCGE